VLDRGPRRCTIEVERGSVLSRVDGGHFGAHPLTPGMCCRWHRPGGPRSPLHHPAVTPEAWPPLPHSGSAAALNSWHARTATTHVEARAMIRARHRRAGNRCDHPRGDCAPASRRRRPGWPGCEPRRRLETRGAHAQGQPWPREDLCRFGQIAEKAPGAHIAAGALLAGGRPRGVIKWARALDLCQMAITTPVGGEALLTLSSTRLEKP